ncbi:MAG: 4-hydroxy-tetrahydrodipicolinate synthase [Proteobacteria bacterium]|nr:4-hydroxy-tetrahydrodipicolinate synthase [Pseudomonadota bacterium]
MFKGSCVALITPMKATGEVDEKALIALVEWHIQEGTDAIVVTGSTGESATLSEKEHHEVTALVVKTAKKRLPIIAGTGTNATTSTIALTNSAKELGVDACLIVAPYYNRPTQAGLTLHYQAVAKAVNIPILLYNVPSRTACDILPETVASLSKVPTIVGIKDATGNIARLSEMREKCRPDFMFYSGDDPTCLEFIEKGGHGVISITANVAPKAMHEMCHLALSKEFEKAKAMDARLQPLHHMMIAQANPIPVKWAMNHLGKAPGGIRLPLTTLTSEHHDKMLQALKTANIIH